MNPGRVSPSHGLPLSHTPTSTSLVVATCAERWAGRKRMVPQSRTRAPAATWLAKGLGNADKCSKWTTIERDAALCWVATKPAWALAQDLTTFETVFSVSIYFLPCQARSFESFAAPRAAVGPASS